jgi:hypothetical protein
MCFQGVQLSGMKLRCKDDEKMKDTTQGRRGSKARKMGGGPGKTKQQTAAPDMVSRGGA